MKKNMATGIIKKAWLRKMPMVVPIISNEEILAEKRSRIFWSVISGAMAAVTSFAKMNSGSVSLSSRYTNHVRKPPINPYEIHFI